MHIKTDNKNVIIFKKKYLHLVSFFKGIRLKKTKRPIQKIQRKELIMSLTLKEKELEIEKKEEIEC